jgi:hypothetical protein
VTAEGDDDTDPHVRDVAAALGLSIIGPFAHGTFGAVAVATADGEELVLKAQPDPTLEPVWTTGAEMAARLHERGYPNPRILRVGSTGAAVWSLEVTGVLDWEIAGPGDWRFDLVVLAFGCHIAPGSCEPAASELVTEAVRFHCPDDVAALMMACQVLRLASMTAARSPDRSAKACGRMVAALDPWLR